LNPSIIQILDIKTNDEKVRLDDDFIMRFLDENDHRKSFLSSNYDLVKEIAENDITHSDVIALAYRKKQLANFNKLLTDKSFFADKEDEWGLSGKERVWQHFFEKNPWIFGYGLNYIFTSNLPNQKLEQVVSGYNFNQSGKRIDALLKTKGLISSLCFLEIKTHETKLLQDREYRSNCWRISNELAGSISQIQKTIQKAIKEIKTKTELKDTQGDPTGDVVYLYQPKSYIIIGSLQEFYGSQGVNETKFSSFELFCRNISNPVRTRKVYRRSLR